MVFQLSSRTGIITLFLLYLYGLIYLIINRINLRKSLYFTLGVIVLVTSLAYLTSQYTEMQREVNADDQESSFGVRLSMWKSSKTLVFDHFFFGVGTGDVNDELQKQFASDGIKRAVRDNLNLHNQFLQTQVAVGVFGSLSLVVMLVLPLWPSIRRGRFFYPLFFVVLGINFLTESVLKTQAGVVFYAVMNSVIFFTYEIATNQKKAEP
jgi:O-antigen ligase